MDTSPTYDGNGNLASDGTFSYCYDTESRLTSILSAGTCASPTTTVATYGYDAQGRRKSRTVGGTTTLFVTDADNREVLEYNGSGVTQRWYAYGPGSNDVLNQMDVATGTRATLIPDIQGSVIGSLASGGTLTKTGYRSFGENPSLTSGTFNYTAQRFDAEAASAAQPSGLYYYRARTYSPTWGRFLQPDPSSGSGTNLYAYVGNDPLSMTDPSGLAAEFINQGQVNQFEAEQYTYQLQQQAAKEHPLAYTAAVLAPVAVTGCVLLCPGATAIAGGGALTEAGAATGIADVTAAGSRVGNIAANLTAREFQSNLVSSGYRVVQQTIGPNGPVTVLSNGTKTYNIYTATSTNSVSAQVLDAAGQILSKIRLTGP